MHAVPPSTPPILLTKTLFARLIERYFSSVGLSMMLPHTLESVDSVVSAAAGRTACATRIRATAAPSGVPCRPCPPLSPLPPPPAAPIAAAAGTAATAALAPPDAPDAPAAARAAAAPPAPALAPPAPLAGVRSRRWTTFPSFTFTASSVSVGVLRIRPAKISRWNCASMPVLAVIFSCSSPTVGDGPRKRGMSALVASCSLINTFIPPSIGSSGTTSIMSSLASASANAAAATSSASAAAVFASSASPLAPSSPPIMSPSAWARMSSVSAASPPPSLPPLLALTGFPSASMAASGPWMDPPAAAWSAEMSPKPNICAICRPRGPASAICA